MNALKLDATFTFWHLTQFYLSGSMVNFLSKLDKCVLTNVSNKYV